MKIAIVDDEQKWRELSLKAVEDIADKLDEIEVFESGNEFLRKSKFYDVVLMDLDMPQIDGFKTIVNYKRDNPDSFIVILTTHLECSRKGYLVNAFRYVDKIKMEEELKEAFDKIRIIRKKNSYSLIGMKKDVAKNISVKDILYIETNGKKTIINTLNEQFDCNEKINYLEKELEEYDFFRCHKSFLINLNQVERIDKEFAYFTNNKKAYISVRKYVQTKKRYIATKKLFAYM